MFVPNMFPMIVAQEKGMHSKFNNTKITNIQAKNLILLILHMMYPKWM